MLVYVGQILHNPKLYMERLSNFALGVQHVLGQTLDGKQEPVEMHDAGGHPLQNIVQEF